MTVKVIGVGVGRTGTKSLKSALEILDFGPCYHMCEISNNPGHVQKWHEALRDNTANWDDLFANYNSTVDWPASHFYTDLLKTYPNAKFILTVREPDSWYQSASETIFKAMEIGLLSDDPVRKERCGMSSKLILETFFSNRYKDKLYAIEQYLAHNEAVRQTIPQNQLLEYEVAEGWESLCSFLDKEVPSVTFPSLNLRQEFIQNFNTVLAI